MTRFLTFVSYFRQAKCCTVARCAHGCSAGGTTNVIASLLAGAEAGTDPKDQGTLSDYQRECQLGAQQEAVIEKWAKAVGLWTECVEVDCDIRINAPELRQGGRRTLSTDVRFIA